MTRFGTLRVTAPPPSPPQNSPHQSSTPAQSCARPPHTPQTPSTTTPNPSPHPSPPTPSQQPPTPLRQPPLSKNLRWTAVALVSKLSKELERPSSAIADEVALAASRDMRTRFPERDVAPVERNTRRRVYDALKVMVAVGCIQRHAKNLRWIGVDHLRYLKATNAPNIRVSMCESRTRIGRKKAMLAEMHRTVKAFDALLTRHHREQQLTTAQSTLSTIQHRIHFPMVVVNAKRPHVSYAPDRKRVRVTAHAPFKVYSETDLVTILEDRNALKRVKLPKKRKPARPNSAHSRSPHRRNRSANLTAIAYPPQPSSSTRLQGLHGKPLELDTPNSSSNHPVKFSGEREESKQSKLCKEEPQTTKKEDVMNKSPCHSPSPSRQSNQVNESGHGKEEVHPEKVVKVEPEEASMIVAADNTGGLPEQARQSNTRTMSSQSKAQGGQESESACPSTTAAHAERDVTTAPLVCAEELGIPPLADGYCSPSSDDDPMTGWKAGEGDRDFEQVLRPPLFNEV